MVQDGKLRMLVEHAMALRKRTTSLKSHIGAPNHRLDDSEVQLLVSDIEHFLQELDLSAVLELTEHFQALASATSDVIYSMSSDWREMRHLKGRDFIPDTVVPSQGWLEKYIPQSDRSLVVQSIQHAIDTETTFDVEHRVIRRDGTVGWTRSRAIPIRDAQGDVAEWFGAAADITVRKEAETLIRDKENLLAAILHTATDAIVTINADGFILIANPAAHNMFGFEPGELIGKNVGVLMPEPFASEHPTYIDNFLRTGMGAIIGVGRELVGRRKDGSHFPIALSVSEVDHQHIFTGIIRDISARKELQRAVLQIADDEDRRIGSELHDNVQQQITGVGLIAASLVDGLPNETSGHTLATRVATGLKDVAEKVSSLARGLVPVDVRPEGLAVALQRLAIGLREQHNVQSQFIGEPLARVEDEFEATHLFRIATEAVQNALKHGYASQIDVSLTSEGNHTVLRVRDNGIGFDPTMKQIDELPGAGLRTMQYRASLMGAALRIRSREPSGVEVECFLQSRGA